MVTHIRSGGGVTVRHLVGVPAHIPHVLACRRYPRATIAYEFLEKSRSVEHFQVFLDDNQYLVTLFKDLCLPRAERAVFLSLCYPFEP